MVSTYRLDIGYFHHCHFLDLTDEKVVQYFHPVEFIMGLDLM